MEYVPENIKHDCLWIDLLDPDIEDRYLKTPKALENEIRLLLEKNQRPRWVIIDEVQKNPRLLDRSMPSRSSQANALIQLKCEFITCLKTQVGKK